MTDPTRDAFTAGMHRLYGLEQALVAELDVLSSDVSIDTLDNLYLTECRERLRDRIDRHHEETATQLERLEAAFDAIDEEPAGPDAPELDGWNADKEQFNNVVLNDELRPLYYLDAAKKLEELERSAYEPVVALAEALERIPEDVVESLDRNHEEEREMLEALEALADGDAVETLLEASQVDSGDRAALDRTGTRTRSINIETLEDIFVYQLWNAYYVAQHLPAVLQASADDVERDDLREALVDYHERTTERTDRLDDVFDALGTKATASRNRTFDGLIESRHGRLEADTDANDLLALETARATARFEIRCYDELHTIAERIGFSHAVVDPLAETLAAERETLAALEDVSYRDLLQESPAGAAE